jgi:hypothetical protein
MLSGLDVIVEPSAMGITVCQVEGHGCAYPAESCFCQCMGGGDCAYWNYYYREPGDPDWTYSPLGAVLRKAKSGSVEAWVWGDGHAPPAAELSFEVICMPPAPVLEPTNTIGPTSAVGMTNAIEPTDDIGPTDTAGSTDTPEPPMPTSVVTSTAISASPTIAQSPTPMPTFPTTPTSLPVPEPGTNLSSYWPFGLMVLGLAVVGAVVWLRRS